MSSKLLNTFSYMALVSSFLWVSMGLFDYLADFFILSDDAAGRTRTVLGNLCLTNIGRAAIPSGFLYAIGFAGLAAILWAVIVTAM